MFPYGIVNANGLKIKQSVINKGSIESKIYETPGIGPTTQPEFYIYINGEIELTNGDFKQVMTESQSGFDVTLDSYNISFPVEEKVLTTAATRFAVYSNDPWEKNQYTLQPNEVYTFTKSGIVFVMSGSVFSEDFGMEGFSFRPVEAGISIKASTVSKIIVCNLLG